MAPIQRVRPRKAVEIEATAESVIQRFQPDHLRQVGAFDVERFFEFQLEDDTGVTANCKDLPRGVDGYTDSAEMSCNISKSLYECTDNIVKIRRLRSTIAHEIGHCYLHVPDARQNREYQNLFRNDQQYRIELYDPNDLKVYENPEWQAWRFASALLMPEKCFRRVIEKDWTRKMIQRGFEVNPSFIDVRMKELGIKKILRAGS